MSLDVERIEAFDGLTTITWASTPKVGGAPRIGVSVMPYERASSVNPKNLWAVSTPRLFLFASGLKRLTYSVWVVTVIVLNPEETED